MAEWRRAAFGEPPPLFPAAASIVAAQHGRMQGGQGSWNEVSNASGWDPRQVQTPMWAPSPADDPNWRYSQTPQRLSGNTGGFSQQSSGRCYSPSSPTKAEEEEIEEVVNEEEALPSRIFDCPGTVVIYQAMAGSGILEVEDGGGKTVYCFFLASQLQGFLRHHLRAGDKVSVHARLVTAGSKVPYLASSLWLSGSPSPGDTALKALLTPAPPPLLEKYLSLSEDLAIELPSPGTGRGQKRPPERGQMLKFGSKIETGGSESETGLIPGKRARQSSELAEANLVEEWGTVGTRGKVDRYLTPYTGLVTVSSNKKTLAILFHVNQVWAYHSFGPSPFLETQPLANLKLALPPGAEVFLNGKRVSGVEGVDLQATAVWTSRQPPQYLQQTSLLPELRLRLSEHLFRTTREEQYKTNPLAGAGDLCVLGTVVEFISQEAGLIRLDGTQDAALFHLEQVWRKGRSGLELILPKLESNLKDCALPLGSKVFVNVRRLPAHPGSCLSYQAILLWKCEGSESGSQPLPPPYLAKYKPLEARRELVARLDQLHSRVKAVLHLDFQQPSYAEPGPVHCVVDTVSASPTPIKARVTAVQGDQGVITMFTLMQEEIPVLFHIEDVWDHEGVPALKSSITMQDLQLVQVEVICRTMPGLEDKSSIELVQMASRFRGAPLLQAVAVVVVGGPVKAVACPCSRPTKLREMPGWFGCSGGTFLLAPTLAARLNIKVAEWAEMARPGLARSLPKVTRQEELDRLKQANLEICKLDTHQLDRFICGEWSSKDVEEVNRTALPEALEGHRMVIKYLHRPVLRAEWGLGEVEVMSGTSDPQQVLRMFSGEEVNNPPTKSIRTFVLFRLADYKFFTTPDYFASDLANVLPISSTDIFFVHAKRVLAKGPVPYVATALWNETLRRELGVEETPTERSKLDHKAVVDARKLVSSLDNQGVQHSKEMTVEEEVEDDASMLHLPEFVGRVCSEVTTYSSKWLVKQAGKVSACLEGEEGRVEQILTSHLAIVTIREERRVLVSSEDVFSLKKGSKFSTSKELFLSSIRKRDLSLKSVLQAGQKVFLNAVPLISMPPNAAQVHYTSCGLVVAKTAAALPVHCVPSSQELTEEFKLFYMKVLKELDEKGQLDPASTIHSTNHPVKIPRRALPKLKTGWLKEERMVKEVTRAKKVEEVYVKKPMLLSTKKLETEKTNVKRKLEVEQQKLQKKEKKVKKSMVLPPPVSSVEPAAPVVVWESLLTGKYGQVLRIIDKNYGLAVGFIPAGTTIVPFQMLFDTFDVFVGDKTCSELGNKLSDVMAVGDFIKFNAAKIESETQEAKVREVPYMTTALVVAKTVDEIKAATIPDTAAVVTSLDQVTKDKIGNFRTVTNFLGGKKPTSKEEALLEEISRGELASQVLDPPTLPTRGNNEEVVLEDSETEETDEEEEGDEKDDQNEEDDDEIMIVEERHVGVVKELHRDETKPVKDTSKASFQEKEAESRANEAEETLDELSKELRPSKLRQVVMAYIGMLSRTEDRTVDVVKLRDSSQPEIETDFLVKFLLSLGEVCKVAKKGLKVGHVFITQSQVTLIQERGALELSHLTGAGKQPPSGTQDSDILAKLGPNALRKVLLGFVQLIEGKTTLTKLGLETGVVTDLKEVLKTVVGTCKANVKTDGNKGFKLQNIFINSNLANQIATKGSAVIP